MKLNRTTQYAIKILAHMSNDDSRQLFSAQYISEKLAIPYKYMTRLMSQLVNAELLLSIRGREGGYKLAKNSSDITILDILNAACDPLDSHICILGSTPCNEHKKCALHDAWRAPKKSIANMFKNTTLDKLKNNNNNFCLTQIM